MSQTTSNSSGFKAFTTAAAIVEGQRVKMSAAGTIDVAGATDKAIGVATEAAASGAQCTVKLFSAPGTFLMRAGGAITALAQLYPVASGNVDDAGTTPLDIIALEAATNSGDVIECAFIQVGA